LYAVYKDDGFYIALRAYLVHIFVHIESTLGVKDSGLERATIPILLKVLNDLSPDNRIDTTSA
jgi:hypothetical protein